MIIRLCSCLPCSKQAKETQHCYGTLLRLPLPTLSLSRERIQSASSDSHAVNQCIDIDIILEGSYVRIRIALKGVSNSFFSCIEFLTFAMYVHWRYCTADFYATYLVKSLVRVCVQCRRARKASGKRASAFAVLPVVVVVVLLQLLLLYARCRGH